MYGLPMAVVLGVRAASLGLTAKPSLTAAGFILAGLGGLMAGLQRVSRRLEDDVALPALALPRADDPPGNLP